MERVGQNGFMSSDDTSEYSFVVVPENCAPAPNNVPEEAISDSSQRSQVRADVRRPVQSTVRRSARSTKGVNIQTFIENLDQ